VITAGMPSLVFYPTELGFVKRQSNVDVLCLCKTKVNHIADHDKLGDHCRTTMMGNNETHATDINVEGT
jgi:hypothetical protein